MAQDNETRATLDAEVNPFAPPLTYDDEAAIVAEAGAGEAGALQLRLDIDAFVGKRSAYYWHNWKDALLSNGRAKGVHIPAFFLSFAWLIYRKLYKECAVLFAVTAVASVAIELLIGESHILERAVSLVFSIAMAGNANHLYLRKARRALAEARALHPNPHDRRKHLARMGGTSWHALFLCFLAALAVLAIIASMTST